MRATTSTLPPGAKETMRRMGRVGYGLEAANAAAGVIARSNATKQSRGARAPRDRHVALSQLLAMTISLALDEARRIERGNRRQLAVELLDFHETRMRAAPLRELGGAFVEREHVRVAVLF